MALMKWYKEKRINFIRSQPLRARLFNIPCGGMGNVHAALPRGEIRRLSQEKHVWLFALWTGAGCFFLLGTSFFLAGVTGSRTMIMALGHLTDIFLKEVSFWLQGKRTDCNFFASDKLEPSREHGNFAKLISTALSLKAPRTCRLYWCVTLGWTAWVRDQYFPNGQYMMLQDHGWIKDPFKMQGRLIQCTEY